MSTRHQRGYVFRKGGFWYVRYYDFTPTGERRQCCRKLVDYCDRYRTKKDVRPLAEEFLRPLNAGKVSPQSTMTVIEFVEHHYFPYAEQQNRPSTLKGYRHIYRYHVRDRLGLRCVTSAAQTERNCFSKLPQRATTLCLELH